MVGTDAAQAIQALIEVAHTSGSGVIATVAGGIVLLLGASGLFGQLKDALNTIWEIRPGPERGWRGTLLDHLLSIAMLLISGALLLALLALSAGISALSQWLGDALPGGVTVWRIANALASFGLLSVLCGLIYRVLPDVEIAWGDIGIGAVVTALLLTLGAFLIGLYLGVSNPQSAYGAAASLVAILIWVYYSAQVFFLGAEFTQVYANKYGSRIRLARKAVLAEEEAAARDERPPAVAPSLDSALQAGTLDRERRLAALKGAILGALGGGVLGAVGLLLGTGRRVERLTQKVEPPRRHRAKRSESGEREE